MDANGILFDGSFQPYIPTFSPMKLLSIRRLPTSQHPPSSRRNPRYHQNENPNPVVNHTLPCSFALPKKTTWNGDFGKPRRFVCFQNLCGGVRDPKITQELVVLIFFGLVGQNIHADCWMLSCCWNSTCPWIWSDFWVTGCTDVFSNNKWWPGMKVRFLMKLLPYLYWLSLHSLWLVVMLTHRLLNWNPWIDASEW